MNINQTGQAYSTKIQDKTFVVPQVNIPVAAEIDTDKDFFLSKEEVANYVTQGGEKPEASILDDQTNEFQCAVAAAPNPYAAGYHSFDALIADFDKLTQENPNYVKKEILGKSPEGRDLVAYKFSEGAQGDTSAKLGVVITGCHHAREWMTVEAPLAFGKSLLDGIASDSAKQQRLHESEVWIVPCANPDGYEYSRTTDSWWRKTRRPIEETGCPNLKGNKGVDPNRNYWDGKPEHFELYRPAGDTPCSTRDDFGDGKTSDNPKADTYRGPSGGSEPEVQAMLNLELNPANNIKGVLDYHSYGDMILYPYGSKELPADRLEIYRDIGSKMNATLGNTFDLKPSSDLYPTSGGSNDLHEANGILGLTLEIGRSFQPPASQIPKATAAITPANLVFIDEIKSRYPQA